MSVLCIVQARLGSSRLPNKSLMPIGDQPLIAHVLHRAGQIRGVDYRVLAVPYGDLPAFRNIVSGWVVMGFHDVPDDDVLQRFARVLERYPNSDTVMRLTGDCPLLDPLEAERVLEKYLHYRQVHGCEYCCNVAPGYVDGEDVEVCSASALKAAHRDATDPYDREHVTPWVRRHATRAAIVLPLSDRAFLKTSVDTIADLERVRAMVAACP